MLTPKTKTENLLYWLASFLLAIVLIFLGSLAKQLPGDAEINWRLIWLDVISAIIAFAPIVAAGLGLPRLGSEVRATLVKELGTTKATEVLQDAVHKEEDKEPIIQGIDYDKLATKLLEMKRRDDLLRQNG